MQAGSIKTDSAAVLLEREGFNCYLLKQIKQIESKFTIIPRKFYSHTNFQIITPILAFPTK